MTFEIKIETIFQCSLERAFKTPMLCDLSKIHTGYGFMPKVTHTTNDENWGKPGASKKVYVTKSLTQNGGFGFIDNILERNENKHWKIEVDEFQFWMIGFYKFAAEWNVTELDKNKVRIIYAYCLYSNKPVFYFFNWIFAKLFWKSYMKRVVENVRKMVNNNEPYLYE